MKGARGTVPDHVYTVSQTAEVLHISPSYVYELLRSSVLPGFKLGKRWVVPVSRLEQWINDQS